MLDKVLPKPPVIAFTIAVVSIPPIKPVIIADNIRAGKACIFVFATIVINNITPIISPIIKRKSDI